MTFFQVYLTLFFFKPYQIIICQDLIKSNDYLFIPGTSFCFPRTCEAEGGQDLLHVSPKPLGDLLLLARGGLGSFSLLNQSPSRHLVFLPGVFLSCCVWPRPARRNPAVVPAGSSILGRDVLDPGTPGAWQRGHAF